MSILALNLAWKLRLKQLSSGDKLVLLTLADYANDDGDCWPSIKSLAEKCSMHQRNVIKHLNKLVTIGLVVKRYRHDKKGYRRSSFYNLNLDQNLGGETPPRTPSLSGETPPRTPSLSGETPWVLIEPSYKNNICKVSNETSPVAFKSDEEACTQESKSKTKSSASETDPNVLAIFKYWQQVMNHPRAILDKPRESKIKQALKDYSLDQLKQAIDGCGKTPHNMGQNEHKQLYNDISLILRDAEHIERFIGNSHNSGQNPIGGRAIW